MKKYSLFGLKPWLLCLALWAVFSSPVFAATIADVIYQNGRIYTLDQGQLWAEAVAVHDGKILQVGSNADMRSVTGDETKVIDLAGKFMMPGLVDGHTHPDMGADNYVNVYFPVTSSWDEVRTTLLKYRMENPEATWLSGGMLNWLKDNGEQIEGVGVPSHKSVLDEIISDRPVALWDQGGHAMLLNSKALAIIGLTKDTPDPEGGSIGRDQNGEPTGVLRETATNLVLSKITSADSSRWVDQGLKPFLDELSSYGVTAVCDAYGQPRNMEGYLNLYERGDLHQRIFANLGSPLDFTTEEGKQKQGDLIAGRSKYRNELINPDGIKFVLDGSAAGQTAVMLEPFEGTDFRGSYRNAIEKVAAEVPGWDQQGLAIKSHAIGDRSIREMLDVFETLGTPGEDSPRHSIAHGTFVHPDDIPRFAKLDVVYEASPALWFPSPAADVIKVDIGEERLERLWPIRELDEAGATVSFGSDWPVSFSPNPWEALETIITRQKPGGSKDSLGGEHAIDLATALKIFTINGAYALGLEDETGSILAGKSADMIILERNPFEMPVTKIHEIKVAETIFRGESVYIRDDKGLADSVYLNGKVYTVNEEQPWVDAFAVKNGKFIKVGTVDEVKSLIGESTSVIDLNGRFVMPGIHEDHIHPDLAAESAMNLQLEPTMSWEETKRATQKFLEENPDVPVAYGGNINWLLDNNEPIAILNKPSNKATLDELVSDRPALVWDWGMHAALLNTKALEMVGITRETEDPAGGTIVKDEEGEPTGVLRELAANVAWAHILEKLPKGEKFAYGGIKPAIDLLNSLGITAFSDVWSRKKSLEAYDILYDAGELNARLFVYITDPFDWPTEKMKSEARYAIANAKKYDRPRINVGGIKFLLDGAATGQTAVMVDPFEGTEYHGLWRNDPDYFMKMFPEYVEQGFTIKTHAVGDGAVRKTLDAIELSRKNGSKLRHSVAHAVIVNPDDIKRFKELDAIAEFSPYFWFPGVHVDLMTADIGAKRIEWAFPIRQVLDSGAHVSTGSDWPVAITPNPWPAIESMVTRQVAGGGGQAFLPFQGVRLEEALRIYTMGGAYAMYLDEKSGSIKENKYADFIVLNQNLFEVPITDVHKTEVLKTVLEGQVIYQAAE